MEFLRKHDSVMRPGNLAFTLILLMTVLGINASLYVELFGANGADEVITNTGTPPQVFYTDQSYSLLASTVASVVLTGLCVGILVGKANNEFMKGSRGFESAALFMLLLIVVAIACISTVPRDQTTNGSEDSSRVYEAIVLCLTSVALGMVSVMSGMAREYAILGTGLWFCLAIGALGVTVNSRSIGTDTNNLFATSGTPGDLSATFNPNQTAIVTASVSLLAVIVGLGLMHMFMERKSYHSLIGYNPKARTTLSPRRGTRKSSPRRSPRKLGSLRPKK